MIYKVTILGRPFSINQTYKTAKSKRALYLSDGATQYARDVRLQAKSQWRNLQPLKQDLEITFVYFFENYKVRDHLNFNKLLCDHLSQIIFQNDKQIKISHHFTLIDKRNPRVELYIRPIKDVEERTKWYLSKLK